MASVIFEDNYMARAMAPAEAAYKEAVLRDMWGHLAPKKNKKYKGFMVFTCTAYGGHYELINADFPDLEVSPWFFDAMYEYVCNYRGEKGQIYRFDGIFRNYHFEGEVVCLNQGVTA